jgi:hypothetical protein
LITFEIQLGVKARAGKGEVSQDISYLFEGGALACHPRGQGVAENVGPGPFNAYAGAIQRLSN